MILSSFHSQMIKCDTEDSVVMTITPPTFELLLTQRIVMINSRMLSVATKLNVKWTSGVFRRAHQPGCQESSIHSLLTTHD